MSLAFLVVVVFVIGAATQPAFSGSFSLSQAIAGTAEIAIIAIPVSLLMTVGEIDLSVASVMALSSVIFGRLVTAGIPVGPAVAIVVLAGLAAGLVNAFAVTRLGIPSLVVTIATLALYRGLAYVVMSTSTALVFPGWFTGFGFNTIGGLIPLTALPYIVILLAGAFVLHLSVLGRRMFAVGTSPLAAEYAGIAVPRLKAVLFCVSSALSAVAGIIFTARLSSASPDAALGFELYAITIALLGGVSIFGGKGTLLGVFLATLLVIEVRNLLSLANLAGQVQDMAVGGLLIGVAVTSRLESVHHRASALVTRRRTA